MLDSWFFGFHQFGSIFVVSFLILCCLYSINMNCILFSIWLFFIFWILLHSWSQLLETLPLPNVSTQSICSEICMFSYISYTWLPTQIKWICPTAPTRPVAMLGGFPCTACKHFFYLFWCFYIKKKRIGSDMILLFFQGLMWEIFLRMVLMM